MHIIGWAMLLYQAKRKKQEKNIFVSTKLVRFVFLPDKTNKLPFYSVWMQTAAVPPAQYPAPDHHLHL